MAAPTAGLHFSRELMKRMELKGIHFAEVTLHVGLGSFRPVEVEDLTKHKMDSEQVIIDQGGLRHREPREGHQEARVLPWAPPPCAPSKAA